MTEKSFLITGDWPMRVGVFVPLVLGVSCLLIAIALDLVLVGQSSITVGVVRGIK